ncbi:PREDICTED: hemolin-like isoform X3 [Papilio xuthus]|uniref:Hemolin-like isoform X3 n=1 Tax=Papilio xuthus TaxID=66420 RepID=A0AAJ6Z3J5_PAPXU|nr:PREDICTED: hemolin-like isoform X3 [Papilio xuthus]
MDFDDIVVKESPGLCRCCLSEGCYKDLSTEYQWMDDTEIYADMLLDCFDISISQHAEGPNGANRLICEVCVTRLRDACNFKKQVLASEKKFVDMVGRGAFKPKAVTYNVPIKSEAILEIQPQETEVEFLEAGMDYPDDDVLKDDLGHTSTDDITVSTLPIKGKKGKAKKTMTKAEKKSCSKIVLVEKPKISKPLTKGLIDSVIAGKPDDLDLLPILAPPPAIVWLMIPPVNNITLPCSTVKKVPHLSYSWEKNGDILNVKSNPRIISNKENGTITILNPTEEDIGRYQCFVEQNLRVATSTMINVYDTYLDISEYIEDHIALDKEPVLLDCPVESNPNPMFEWKIKDKKKVNNYTDVIKEHIVMPDGGLWLFNVTKEDALKNISYNCFVTSKVSNKTGLAAEHFIVEVQDNNKGNKYLEKIYTSENIFAEVGKVIKLYCIYSGSPSPNVTWMKDSKRILNSTSRITIDNKNRGQVLIINDVKVEDEGTYTCIVRNKVNSPRRHQIEVIVVMAPTFENIDPVIKVFEGTAVTITFDINARPEPIVLWTLDAQPLFEESTDMELTTIYLEGEPTKSHLTLKNVTQGQTGYYGCKAYNVYGEMYVETLLYVMSF